MSPKEREILREICDRFAAGDVSEIDSAMALILLRDHVSNGPVRELAHAIAHGSRHSGRMFDRTFANVKAFAGLMKKSARQRGPVVARSLITPAEFAKSLNDALLKFELPFLEAPICETVELCAISVLQAASLKRNMEIVPLALVATQQSISLQATAS